MTRLKKLLYKNPITLIVELWNNSAELAESAERFGADALLFRQIEGADKIKSKITIPLGISLKNGQKLPKEILGFDFVDFNLESIDRYKDAKLTRVASLNDKFSIDNLMEIGKKADALDAAIVPITQGIKNLSVGDLQNYISIIISSDLPVIIPSDRSIKPSEAAIIWDAGAKGIILNKNVLGNTPRSFENAIREFRIAIDDLGN